VVEEVKVFVEILSCARVLSSLRRHLFMALETRSTLQKQSVLNRYSRYLFKPLPQVPSFPTGTGDRSSNLKNPVVQVLINSSLVLLVEYATCLSMYAVNFCDCASVQVQLRQTAICVPFQGPTQAVLEETNFQEIRGETSEFIKAFIGHMKTDLSIHHLTRYVSSRICH